MARGVLVKDAGHALADGDPLRALGIAGRIEGALGLTLRGIAYAQIGDLDLARASLEQGVSVARDRRTRARAQAALVEIELLAGDPKRAAQGAKACAEEFTELGDARNAAMQGLVVARAEVRMGHLAEARRVVGEVLTAPLAPEVQAVARLAEAEIAIRALAASDARSALRRARHSLEDVSNPLLARALVAVERELSLPVARVVRGGVVRPADLFTIEEACRGAFLLVDGGRRLALADGVTVSLARTPVLFTLLLGLARAWPQAAARDALAAESFGARTVNAAHRARLRAEIGRLRALMVGLCAEPLARGDGYMLASKREVLILLPVSDDDDARLAPLLADGASWSAQELAENAGVSKKTALRTLAALVASGDAVRTREGSFVRCSAAAPIASRMLFLGLVPKA